MAKVISPLHSISASGKADGLIYSYNQFGPYTRDQVTVSNPNTVDQQTWRNAMSSLASIWESTLSQEQRDGFDAYAATNPVQDRFGKQRFTTGRQIFFQQNIYRVANGLGIRNFPPRFPGAKYVPDSVSLSQEDDGLVLEIDPTPVNEELVYVSKIPAQNLGRKFPPNLNKFSRWIDTNDTEPFIIRPNNELTGEVKRYFFRIVFIDDNGFATPPRWLFTDATQVITEQTAPGNSFDQIDNGNVNTNVCTGGTIASGDQDNQRFFRTIWGFDFTGITIPPPVTSATLSLTAVTVTAQAEEDIFRIIVDNTNCQCTWNDRQTGVGWNTPGLGATTDYQTPSFGTNIINIARSYNWNVTNWVNDILSGVISDQRLLLRSFVQIPGAAPVWATHLNSNPDNRPSILIVP